MNRRSRQSSGRGHVVMLLSNPYRPDPRVRRHAMALLDAGYRVTLVCWDRRGELPPADRDGGMDIVRVHRTLSGYAVGWRQLLRIPRFWVEAVRIAGDLRPDFVHSHDLDTLPPAVYLKKRLGSAVVFDAHENYPALMSDYLPRLLVQGLRLCERAMLPYVDHIVTVGQALKGAYTATGQDKVSIVGNYADLTAFADFDPVVVAKHRSQLGVSQDTLMVGYLGSFSRNRDLLPFIETAPLLPDVELHLWGDGPQRPRIEKAASEHANVTCHGWVPFESLSVYFQIPDILYYALRSVPSARYTAPNTLFQAMASRRPIIASKTGDLGDIVERTGCGVLLEGSGPDAIAEAILRLSNPEERLRRGENGLRAARREYNESIAKERLVAVYESLPGRRSNAGRSTNTGLD